MNWASLERNCEARHQCHERNVATSALRTTIRQHGSSGTTMLRAEVGRQGRLDIVPGILFSAIIWKLRQQSRQVVGPMQRLCGCAGCSPFQRTFRAVEHIGHSTFLPLLSCSCFHATVATVSQNTVTCHWRRARWERNLDPNARDETLMREGFGAPKQSLESGTQKVCPHFFRPLFLSRSRVPKMGPQNRPLAQPWCAKCPRLTDPHLVAYPCAAAIAAATGQPIYWRTFRPILAEALSRSNWWKPAAAFVLSQRSL